MYEIVIFCMNVYTVRCEDGCIHGKCVGLNQCECEDGWTGSTCNKRML